MSIGDRHVSRQTLGCILDLVVSFLSETTQFYSADNTALSTISLSCAWWNAGKRYIESGACPRWSVKIETQRQLLSQRGSDTSLMAQLEQRA